MSPELLQQLLGMLENAGEGSFWLILVYIVYPYFSTLITSGVVVVGAWIAYKWATQVCYSVSVVSRILSHCNSNLNSAPFSSFEQKTVDRWLTKQMNSNE